MSRLENHAMLRDAATDVFYLQYALLEKYGLAAIEGGFFRGKLISKVIVHMKDKSIHRASSVFEQHLKEESRGLILFGNF